LYKTFIYKEWFFFLGCYDERNTGVLNSIRNNIGVEGNATSLFSRCMIKCYHHNYIAVEKKISKKVYKIT